MNKVALKTNISHEASWESFFKGVSTHARNDGSR